jgi:hypothetical protein
MFAKLPSVWHVLAPVKKIDVPVMLLPTIGMFWSRSMALPSAIRPLA